MSIGRRRPYTARGISRVPCFRCGKPSVHQWQICALDRRWVAICLDCDLDLNAMVLTFMRVPNKVKLFARYVRRATEGV